MPPSYWFTDRVAGECSALSPAGLSEDFGNPAKGAGGGVGFGFMERDVGKDGRRGLRLQDKSGDAFVAGGEADAHLVAGGVAGGAEGSINSHPS